jgi:hypothetical protein
MKGGRSRENATFEQVRYLLLLLFMGVRQSVITFLY